jgi:hypothetical protein
MPARLLNVIPSIPDRDAGIRRDGVSMHLYANADRYLAGNASLRILAWLAPLNPSRSRAAA